MKKFEIVLYHVYHQPVSESDPALNPKKLACFATTIMTHFLLPIVKCSFSDILALIAKQIAIGYFAVLKLEPQQNHCCNLFDYCL